MKRIGAIFGSVLLLAFPAFALADSSALPLGQTLVQRLAAGKQDKPAIHELVENVPSSVKIEQAWIGEGSLTLPVCRGEEISDLAPVRCGQGLRASMSYIVDDLKTLKDLRK